MWVSSQVLAGLTLIVIEDCLYLLVHVCVCVCMCVYVCVSSSDESAPQWNFAGCIITFVVITVSRTGKAL